MPNHVVLVGQLLARTASRRRRHSTKAFNCPNGLFSPFAVIFKPTTNQRMSHQQHRQHFIHQRSTTQVKKHSIEAYIFALIKFPTRMASIFARPLLNAAAATSALRSFSTSTYRHGQRLVADRATVNAARSSSNNSTTASAVAGAALAALTIAATATATKSNNAAALRRWYRSTATSRSLSR
jgi:hypothetical protein